MKYGKSGSFCLYFVKSKILGLMRDSINMAESEQQEEEREVLLSIYEGDPAFKQISHTTYQYKVSSNISFRINFFY